MGAVGHRSGTPAPGIAVDRRRVRRVGALPAGAVDSRARQRLHPRHSPLGIAWTAFTAVVMFALAAGKARTGAALGNPVLTTEGRVTLIDGLLAAAVLLGLLLNSLVGWWWADPVVGYVLVLYALREVKDIFLAATRRGHFSGEPLQGQI
ncbi:MAG: cation transporter [Mycobacterium sp.]|nr:cation transporter [Mycobacterium sp.]